LSSNALCPYTQHSLCTKLQRTSLGRANLDVITLEHTPHTNACAFGGGCNFVPHETQVTGVRITCTLVVNCQPSKSQLAQSRRRRTFPQMHLERGWLGSPTSSRSQESQRRTIRLQDGQLWPTDIFTSFAPHGPAARKLDGSRGSTPSFPARYRSSKVSYMLSCI
jgi:hypothetical protein